MIIDLGVARNIDAQSFGQPGERTFRLRLLGYAAESASLWLEKEHVQAMSLALQQVISRLGHEEPPRVAELGDFPDVPDYDLRVGRMSVGFDLSDRTAVLEVEELGSEPEKGSGLRVRLTRGQCASLVVQLDRIIAAGRPTCPLCSLPIDPQGHVCPRSNGHSGQAVPDGSGGDEQ